MSVGKFPKKDIPQPRYKLGEVCVYRRPAGEEKEKGVGLIDEIMILISASGNEVMYKVDGREKPLLEGDIMQRIIL